MLSEAHVKLNKARDTIYSYNGPLEGAIIIPHILKGHKISKIRNGVFGGKMISHLTIEEGYEEIEDHAFGGNPMETIHLPITLKKLGYKALRTYFGKDRSKYSHLFYAGNWNWIVENWENFGLDPRSVPGFKLDNQCGFFDGTLIYINDVPDLPPFLQIPSHIKMIKSAVAKRSFSAKDISPIRSLMLPSSLIEIGDFAFNRNELQEIIIPSNTVKIGREAFSENKLKKVTLNDGIKTIDDHAFSKNFIDKMKIPQGVDYLSGFDRNQLTEISIPNVREIGFFAFYDNDISKLQLHDDIEQIGIGAFYENNISQLDLPKSLKVIYDNAFCKNQIETINFGSNLKSIGNSTFEHNRISSLSLPDSLTNIGYEAFLNNMIINLKMPAALTTLGDGAFGSNQLRRIVWNENIERIGLSENVEKDEGVFSKNYLTSVEIPDKVSYIGNYSFSQNLIKTVTLGESVEHIGEAAFINNQIHSVQFNKGLKIISRWAFMNNQIEMVELFDGLEIIEARAFLNNQISSVIIPSSVKNIGTDAFKSQNHQLKRVIILGNEKRFNKDWTAIGFPKSLMPRL